MPRIPRPGGQKTRTIKSSGKVRKSNKGHAAAIASSAPQSLALQTPEVSPEVSLATESPEPCLPFPLTRTRVHPTDLEHTLGLAAGAWTRRRLQALESRSRTTGPLPLQPGDLVVVEPGARERPRLPVLVSTPTGKQITVLDSDGRIPESESTGSLRTIGTVLAVLRADKKGALRAYQPQVRSKGPSQSLSPRRNPVNQETDQDSAATRTTIPNRQTMPPSTRRTSSGSSTRKGTSGGNDQPIVEAELFDTLALWSERIDNDLLRDHRTSASARRLRNQLRVLLQCLRSSRGRRLHDALLHEAQSVSRCLGRLPLRPSAAESPRGGANHSESTHRQSIGPVPGPTALSHA